MKFEKLGLGIRGRASPPFSMRDEMIAQRGVPSI